MGTQRMIQIYVLAFIMLGTGHSHFMQQRDPQAFVFHAGSGERHLVQRGVPPGPGSHAGSGERHLVQRGVPPGPGSHAGQQASASPSCKGEYFVTIMMQNYETKEPEVKFNLLITAFEDNTKVTVTVNKDTFKREFTVNKHITLSVELPKNIEVSGSTKTNNVVTVKANKGVTVLALNKKLNTASTTIVYPEASLDSEYWIITPDTGAPNSFKEFAVIAGKASMSVVVYLTGRVSFEKKTYAAGTPLTLTLEEGQAVLLQSVDDLSGTKVVTTQPAAVLTGHTCSWKNTKCDHVSEQLLPVNGWGAKYLIAPVSFQMDTDIIFVVVSMATEVKYTVGTEKHTTNLKAGQVLKIENKKNPVNIEASVPIQAIYYSTGSRAQKFDYDTFLMSLLSVNAYCRSYYIYGQQNIDNYAMITMKTSGTKEITIDKTPIPTLKWTKIPGTDYSYAELYLGNKVKSYLVEHPYETFGLQSIGIGSRIAYGNPASCTETPSCENIQCNKNYFCNLVDGKPQCQPESLATCLASGDPHYKSYKGRRFDFQGTCTYTISKSCATNGMLPSFNVEAKNQNRGNTRVAYVSLVTMQVYKQNITIRARDKGRVRVNDVQSGLPITLADGRVRVYQSGGKAVVETEFMKVSYDWDQHLKIDLSSRYTESVCGLCGSNNNDPNNDFATPDGSQAANPTQFGESWKVNDGDPSCWNDCNGPCKTCPPELAKKYEAEEFCGLIKAAGGPFSECLSAVEAQDFLQNCVYDVCLNNGDKKAACQGVKSYADACQGAGANIRDWRTAARCPLDCGPNSQYKVCGTACPNTCEDDAASTNCAAPCVESCECNAGYVLTLGKCVPKSTCGCTYNGLPYAQNQVFWDDDKCERQCTCNPTTKQVECKAAKCKASEKCSIVNGFRGCNPVSYGICMASGDPHYVTIDNLRFDFQGNCVYQFSGLCNKTEGLVDFQVNVQNNHRIQKTVSFTEGVEFLYKGKAITIYKKYPGRVMLNSRLTNLPYSTDDETITIYRACSEVVVKTDNGIKMTYDWQSRITLTLPNNYAGAVCGLCGDFNGNKNNDLTLRGGGKAPSANAFGNSWKVRDTPGCQATKPTPTCSKLEAMKESQRSSGKDCGALLRKDGPFRDCHSKVDPEGSFEDCVFDSCYYNGWQAVFCHTLTSYAVACQAAGATVYSWRTKTFCPMACPLNSHYEVCTTGCPATCNGLPASAACDSTCKEGCTCDDGFILSGDQCVDISQCGCVYQGNYYKKDEVFYPNGKCDQKCTCNKDRFVTCTPFSCGTNEKCTLEDGVQKCQPVGTVTCSATGGQHYKSFNGNDFTFQGDCTYFLAKTFGGDPSTMDFTVKLENKQRIGRLPLTTMLSLEGYNHTLTMTHQKKGVIQVNGEEHSIPINLLNGAVKTIQDGVSTLIQTNFGLKIRISFEFGSKVSLQLPANYKLSTGGLCGNFKEQGSDGFLLPNSKTTTSINEFGSAWAVQSNEICSPVICGSADNPCSNCNDGNMEAFKKKDYCGFLVDPDGPLSNCYNVINPKTYLENCVLDLCAGNGEARVLCQSIQSYVADCQAAGVKIKPWRSNTFCPFTCPANSVYSICSETCDSCCAGIDEPLDCPDFCNEGCECNEDHYFDGQNCVTMDKCGCYENGRYYPLEMSILSSNCSVSCMCSPKGDLLCQSHSCADDETCINSNGILKCINPAKQITSTIPAETTLQLTTLTTPEETTTQLTTLTTPEEMTSQLTTLTTLEETTSQLTTLTTPEETTSQLTTLTTPEETTSQLTTLTTPEETTSQFTTLTTSEETTFQNIASSPPEEPIGEYPTAPVGTEFVFPCPRPLNENDRVKVVFNITAYEEKTNCTILFEPARFRKEMKMTKGQTASVTLTIPAQILMTETIDSSFKIRSDKQISVVSVTSIGSHTETTQVLPQQENGVMYYVVTPLTKSEDDYKEFCINNYQDPNKVVITLTGTVTFQEKTYQPGSTITLTLESYQKICLRSKDNLTGSSVSPTYPVVVSSGFSSSENVKVPYRLSTQLPPASRWGLEYLFSSLASPGSSDIVYVVASKRCELKYQVGEQKQSQTLEAGQVAQIEIPESTTMAITASTAVLVMYYCRGGNRDNQSYEPFLVNMPDTTTFSTKYQIIANADYVKRIAIFIAEDSVVKDITMDNKPLSNLEWKPILGTKYSTAKYDIGKEPGSHTVESSKNPFGLMVIGFIEKAATDNTDITTGGEYPTVPVGTEFVFPCPRPLNENDRVKVAFNITAYQEKTNCTILFEPTRFRKEMKMTKGQTASVTLTIPAQILMTETIDSSFKIRSDKQISVVSVTSIGSHTETTQVLPQQENGVMYYVVTPLTKSEDDYKEFCINNYQDPNKVVITLTGTVTFQEKTYQPGSTITLTLESYQKICLRSKGNLTGSSVSSTYPVVVSSGFSSSENVKVPYRLSTQLPPASRWGQEYLFSSLASPGSSDIVYVVASNRCELKYQVGEQKQSQTLEAGQVAQIEIPESTTMAITASTAVLVMYYCRGGNRDNQSYEPFLVNMPDTTTFSTKYQIIANADYVKRIAIFIAEDSVVKDITMDKKTLSDLEWKPILGTRYSTAIYDIENEPGSHIVESSKSPIGLLIIEFIKTVATENTDITTDDESMSALKGKQFSIPIPTSINLGVPTKLVLHITAHSSETTTATVIFKITEFKKEVVLMKKQTATLTLTIPAERMAMGINNLAGIVESDKPISVVTETFMGNHVETNGLLPLQQQEYEYYVVTPAGRSIDDYIYSISIVNFQIPSKVVINANAKVKFQGKTYPAGSIMTVSLDSLQEVTLESTESLTGTRVVSPNQVSVSSGYRSSETENSPCRYVSIQLTPTSQWGNEFVVPPLAFSGPSDKVFVIASQMTNLKYKVGKLKLSQAINAGEAKQIEMQGSPLHITANKDVMVMYYFSGGNIGGSKHHPYMVNIPDVTKDNIM